MNVFEVVIAFLAISAVVGWHELGHWLTARWLGFKTPVFSIGMGSVVLFSFYWQETLFTFRALPLGGYVEIPQMVHTDESEEPQLPAWKRLIVINAGIVMNLLAAFALFVAVFSYAGKPEAQVDSFNANSPALSAGLEKGDVFESINGKETSYDTVVPLVQESQPDVNVTVLRGTERHSIIVRKDAENRIGINLGYASKPVSLPEAVSAAFSTTVDSFVLQFKFIASMLGFHTLPPSMHAEMSGPIGITQVISKSLSIGPLAFFSIIAALNIGLAFINLVPIPPLDGGRMLLVLTELCRQKPNPAIFEKVLLYTGGGLMVALMTYTTWHDVWHLFKP